MGPEGAINILYRKEILQAEKAGQVDEERKRLVDHYRNKFANPYKAAELGYIDEVILPEDTRRILDQQFESSCRKTRKRSFAETWKYSPL